MKFLQLKAIQTSIQQRYFHSLIKHVFSVLGSTVANEFCLTHSDCFQIGVSLHIVPKRCHQSLLIHTMLLSLHAIVCRPLPTLGTHPVNVLCWVFDITGFTVNTVLSIDL